MRWPAGGRAAAIAAVACSRRIAGDTFTRHSRRRSERPLVSLFASYAVGGSRREAAPDMHALLRVALITASLLGTAAPLHAQQQLPPGDSTHTAAAPRKWLVGGSIGFPGYDGEPFPELFTVGAHWTQLEVGRPGADFAVGTIPRAVTEGFVAVGARGGVAIPLALSRHVILLPSSGISFLGAVGSGVDGTTGINAGLAAVLLGASGTGVRTGVTWHLLGVGEGALWLFEVGIVRGPRRP